MLLCSVQTRMISTEKRGQQEGSWSIDFVYFSDGHVINHDGVKSIFWTWTLRVSHGFQRRTNSDLPVLKVCVLQPSKDRWVPLVHKGIQQKLTWAYPFPSTERMSHALLANTNSGSVNRIYMTHVLQRWMMFKKKDLQNIVHSIKQNLL